MSKQRYINTKFWSDGFVSELNPLDRYLFLYFLTNEHTNISGIYELPLKTISFETGIELDMLKKMIKRLTSKVEYIDGWVWIRNFQKHQNQDSPKIKIGIENEMAKVPPEVIKKIKGMDTVSIPHTYVSNYSDPNSIEIKEISSVAIAPVEWSLESKLQEMEKVENSYLDIIATFIREKPVKIENSKQLSAVITRYCRVAKKLAGAYTNKQIFDAVGKIKADNAIRKRRGEVEIDYTLETVMKSLTK